MRNLYKTPYNTLLTLAAGLLFLSGVASAHHGSGISYDTGHLWTTWATVTEFNYLNPHPSMTFDRTTKDGKVEHWTVRAADESVRARSRGMDEEPEHRSAEARHQGQALHRHVTGRRT